MNSQKNPIHNGSYITLDDGRKLGFQEYGNASGFPVLGLHGTPGSRIWFTENDEVSKRLGVRLITIDRPGYGLSDPLPKRRINDFNVDISGLLEELAIHEFSLFGVSGGGAFALSFATSGDSGIYRTGLIASVCELENGRIDKDMSRPNRIAILLARRFPWLLKYGYRQQKYLLENKPEMYITSIRRHISHLSHSDQLVMQDDAASWAMVAQLKEAFSNSANEAVFELKLLSENWNIDYNNINRPVEIWHGEEDTLSPLGGIIKLSERIPNCNINILKDRGHFLDEDVQIWEKILVSLIPEK